VPFLSPEFAEGILVSMRVGEEIRDRRTKFRFPIRRELRFKLAEEGLPVETGAGETVNLGSGGVAFEVDRELKIDALVELSISWPILLDESCPMRLIVFGRVLRSTKGQAVCTIDKYEFRTQARSIRLAATVRDSMLLRWADTLRKENLKTRAAIA
jgi:hypothetical protein